MRNGDKMGHAKALTAPNIPVLRHMATGRDERSLAFLRELLGVVFKVAARGQNWVVFV
ncbi:MAG: hypothetical protein AAF384_19460 [Pseudomonadota bacterium]